MIIKLNSSDTIYNVDDTYVDKFTSGINKMKLEYTKYESVDKIPSHLIPKKENIEKMDKITKIIKDALVDINEVNKPIDYLRFKDNWSYITLGKLNDEMILNNSIETNYEKYGIDIETARTVYAEYILDTKEETTLLIVLCLDTGLIHIEKQQSDMVLPYMWYDATYNDLDSIADVIKEYTKIEVDYT